MEYVEDPDVVIRSAAGVLKSGGSLIVLAPQGQALFGTLDRSLGHRRRFSQAVLRTLFEQNGFSVRSMHQLNKIGTVGWWLFGKVLRRKRISKVMLKIFDKTVWFWRHFDGVLPWPSLTLVAVATSNDPLAISFTGGVASSICFGAHLSLAAGGQVRVIDESAFRPRSEILADASREQMEWDRSDIRDASAMLSAIRGGEIVFHLAAIPSVPRSIQDPCSFSSEINIDGIAFNVLRAFAVDAKVRRVVYAASSSASGDTECAT